MRPSVGLPSQMGASSQLCRRCFQLQTAIVARSQRRWIGQKYLAKQDAAQNQWDERAERIQAGELRNLWDIFEERGYIKDLAGQRDHIRELMRRKRIGAYVGIDPTAQSLHVGHLLPLMPLFWMYLHGYQAVSLIGGATAKIGDPTDRLKSRDSIPPSTMTMNMTKIHYQLKKVWVNVEAQGRKYGYKKEWAWKRALVNNNAWWNSTPLLEVLKRLGASIRIGPMLSRDTVKRKLTEGDGMSFAEFSYPLMQGWDWWHMFRSRGVQMQIGGSDQYGNIVTGIDTVKICRANEPNPAEKLPETEWDDPVGFTVPLLTDSSGVKFGKSAGNAVWLDKWLTNTFDLYGYFVRRPDADVEKLLKLFTFLPLEEIHVKVEEHNIDPSKRVAQHLLAYEVVSLVHGEEAAREAQEQHRSMYGKRTVTDSGETSEYSAVEGHPTTLNNAPRVDMQLPESLIMGKSIGRILYAAGLASSTSDGHRLAQQKGAHIGGSPGQKPNVNKGMLIGQLDFTPIGLWFPEDTKRFLIDGKMLVLRKGKHNVRIIEMVSDEEWEASGKKYPGQPGTGKIRQLRDQLQSLKEGTYEPNPDDPSEPMIVFPKRKNVQQLEDKIEQLSKSSPQES